jgi:LacI family transcriptional regulator
LPDHDRQRSSRLRRDERVRPSVYEVAERAGVSIATVSRVLRGSAPVADQTRERVLEAAEALHWRPSRLARGLVERSHGAIGIVFPDLAGPYYTRVIQGFEAEAVERRYAVLILATHGRDRVDELVGDLADRTDGLVVMGRTVPDEFITELDRPGVPIVLLARPSIGGIPAVRAANVDSAEAITGHLIEHGCQPMAFVGDPERSPDVAERWRGFRRALRKAGRRAPTQPIRCGGFEAEHGYKAAVELLAGDDRPDGLVCANDEIASGVCRAAESLGLHVPDHLAVTGWDDSPMAARLEPPLTTVHQPMRTLGERAAAALFDRIDGQRVRTTVLRTSVVIRESCGCAPPATDASDLTDPTDSIHPPVSTDQTRGTR